MTFKEVKQRLKKLGIIIRKTDDEYRVAYTQSIWSTLGHDDSEQAAYYTDDLQDALDTGISMRKAVHNV